MTDSGELQCGPCNYEHVTKSAGKWCADCKEGLCNECFLSHNADHLFVAVEMYQKTERLNVNIECLDHSKQFDFYCPAHDSVVCVECVQLEHTNCKDLRPLDEAAKGSKSSHLLSDLEQTIDELLEYIERGIQHLQQNQTNLKEHEYVIKKLIAKKRKEINEHLDRLQGKLLKTLKSKSEKAANEMSVMMAKLETNRKHILDLKDKAQNIKQYSSNLQVFVGTRNMMKNILNEKNVIKLFVGSIPQLSVSVQISTEFDTFTEVFESLGEIEITSKEAVVPYVERQQIRVQNKGPAEPLVHKLNNLQLKLRTNIKMGERNSDVTSCVILPNKGILIVSSDSPFLNVLKEDGSHDLDISVPYNPFYVTIIDEQKVAVAYGNKCISIVNLSTQRTAKTLENLCKVSIWGISFNDGKLYAVAHEEGIKVIDLDGKIIKTIRVCDDARDTFNITTEKDKIYYTVINGSVYCVDMEGTVIWNYQDDRILFTPVIAVDSLGITFAAGYDKNLLLAISPDGKQQKVLLTSSDELQDPNAVYYDKDSKRLLVCNGMNGHAALYDVIY